MPKTRRVWDDRTPLARRPSWPRGPRRKAARDPQPTDVVIVGGGLTGAACAYAFAAAGHSVVLCEAGRIASGATAGSAGLLRAGFDAPFSLHDQMHGRRAARTMWQQSRRAVLDFAALIRRLGIRCDLESTSVVTVSQDQKAAAKEYASRRDAGLEVTKLTANAAARETAMPGFAMRTPDAFVFDPVRATLGLITHAEKHGARVHEGTAVTRITHLPRNKGVIVKTAGGALSAKAVVIAAGTPGPLVPQLRRHFTVRDTYLVVTDPLPAAMRRGVGARTSVVMDGAEPPHTVRFLKDDRVLVAGADQPPVPSRLRDRTLVQRTGQLLYELSLMYPDVSGIQPAFSWDAPLVTTVDGAPYIGPHRNLPGHLFALGFGRHGDGQAWLAARALVRYYEAAPNKEDAVFGFTRHD